MAALPEEIIGRFRTAALDRLRRIEEAWTGLIRGGPREVLEPELHLQAHTLKGDSRIVGFTDVNLLAQKLEELLFLAAQRDYQVPDELDMVVGMAIQFIGMLVRKRAG